MNLDAIRRGLLVEVQRRSAHLIDESGAEFHCTYSPEIDLRAFANFAVGDHVEFYPGDAAQEPLITAILPRKNKISRPGPSERYAREQILAANVDVLVAVATPAQPAFNPRLVDRYLALAEHFGVEAWICLNKSDLDPAIPEPARYLRQIGYPVLSCSTKTGAGIPELRAALRGRLAVLSGPSGAGKSSLIRALIPGTEVRVEEVRTRDGKGRHTTTTGHLYASSDGVRVIDTPGLRELGLWGVEPSEVGRLWRDFRLLVDQCRFKDCRHRTEPGCAIHAAVAAGTIPSFRLESYYRVLDTLGKHEAWE